MQAEPKGITKSMSRLSTQSMGPRRGGLTHLNSSGNSSNNSSKDESNGLSRESSTEYTDSTGIDLHEFIISTLKTKDRVFVLNIERELLSLINDSSRSSYTFGPYNAYERMLIHRVAAYFGCEHNLSEPNCVCVSKTSTTRTPDLKFDKVEGYNENAYHEKQHSLKLLKRNDGLSQSLESSDRRIQNGKYNSQRSKSYEERQKNYDATRDRIFAKDEARNTGSTAIKCSTSSSKDDRPRVVQAAGSGDEPRILHKPTISVSDSDDTEAITAADSSLKQSSHDSSVDTPSSTVNCKSQGQSDWPPLAVADSPSHSHKSVESPKRVSPAFSNASKMSNRDKSKGTPTRESTLDESENNNNTNTAAAAAASNNSTGSVSGSNNNASSNTGASKQNLSVHRPSSQHGRQVKSTVSNAERSISAPKKQLQQQKAIDESEGQSDGQNDCNSSQSTDISPSITPSTAVSPSVVVTTVPSVTSTTATSTVTAVSTAATVSTATVTNSSSSSSTNSNHSKSLGNSTYSQRNFSHTHSTSQSNYRWNQSHSNYTGQQYQYYPQAHYNSSNHTQSHHHSNQQSQSQSSSQQQQPQQQQQQQQQQYQTASGNVQATESYGNNSNYYGRSKGHHRKSQPPHSPVDNNGAMYQPRRVCNFAAIPPPLVPSSQFQEQSAQSTPSAVPMAQTAGMSHLLWPLFHDPSRQLTTPVIYNPYAVPHNDFPVDASGMPVTYLPSTINTPSKDVATTIAPQLPPANPHQAMIMHPASASLSSDQSPYSNGLYMTTAAAAAATQEAARAGPSALTVPASETSNHDTRAAASLGSYSAVSHPNAQPTVPLNCLPTAGSSNSTALQQAQSPNGQNLYYINPLPQAMQMMPTTGPFVFLSARQNQMVTPQGFQVAATNQGLLPLPPAYSPYITAATPPSSLSPFAHYPSMPVGQPLTVPPTPVSASRPSPPPATGSYSTSNLNTPQSAGPGQSVSYFSPPQQYAPQYYPFRPPYIFPSGGSNSNGSNSHSYSHRRPNRNHNINTSGSVNTQTLSNPNTSGVSNGQR